MKVHARNKPLAEDVDLNWWHNKPRFCWCRFENVLNEAALVAARRNKSVIDASILRLKIVLSLDHLRKTRPVSQKERGIGCYHEAGHTIVGLVLSNAVLFIKVTIVPVDVQADI